MIYYRYEDIEKFSLEECKMAKLKVQSGIIDVKALLEDLESGHRPDLDGERLERKKRHYVRLLQRVEIRMMECKQMAGIDKFSARADNERRHHLNQSLSSVLKPKPYHSIFCTLAHAYLDDKALSHLNDLTRQKMQELESELQ